MLVEEQTKHKSLVIIVMVEEDKTFVTRELISPQYLNKAEVIHANIFEILEKYINYIFN